MNKVSTKTSINSVNKCICCRNYIFAELYVSYFNGKQTVEKLLQSDLSHYNVR